MNSPTAAPWVSATVAARQKNPLDPSVRLGPLIQAGAYTCR
jgi:hypothetical protein